MVGGEDVGVGVTFAFGVAVIIGGVPSPIGAFKRILSLFTARTMVGDGRNV